MSAPQTEISTRNVSRTGALSDVRALDHRSTCRGLAEGDFIYYGVFLDDGSTICAVAVPCCDIILDNAFPAIKADHLKSVLSKNVMSVGLRECGLALAEKIDYKAEGCARAVESLRMKSGRVSPTEARGKGL